MHEEIIKLLCKEVDTLNKYREALREYAQTLCYHAYLDSECAEDIAQNAMQVLLQQIDNGQLSYFQDSPLAWAKGIARNKFYETFRKEERVTRFLPLLNQEDLPDEETDTIQDTKEFVQIMLAHLTKEERLLIELFYFEGYSDKQTIEMQVTHYKSKNVIKTLRNKAVNKLRKIFPDRKAFDNFDLPEMD